MGLIKNFINSFKSTFKEELDKAEKEREASRLKRQRDSGTFTTSSTHVYSDHSSSSSSNCSDSSSSSCN